MTRRTRTIAAIGKPAAKLVLASVVLVAVACTTGCIGFNRSPLHVGMSDDWFEAKAQQVFWIGMSTEDAWLTVAELRRLSDGPFTGPQFTPNETWIVLPLAPSGISLYALGYHQIEWLRLDTAHGTVVGAAHGRENPADYWSPVWRPIRLLKPEELEQMRQGKDKQSDF